MQPSVINNIHFHYESSLPLHEAEVNISFKKEKPIVHVRAFNGYQEPTVKKSFKITLEQFRELENSIKFFEGSIPDDKTLGLDGSHWFLEYDVGEEKRLYEFWSPEIDTKSRDLEKFMVVCKKIIEIAEIKIEG